MWGTKVGTPVASSDGKDGEFSNDDRGTNGCRNFFRCLDTKTDVTLRVSNNDNRLEAGTLTGAGLLLYRFDLGDLVQH